MTTQGPDDGSDAVDARVAEMLGSSEAMLEAVARTDAGDYAGPDGDARFARFLADQPDQELRALGRALLAGERPADLAESDQFAALTRRGLDGLSRLDGVAVLRVIAENDRSLRRD